MTIPKQAIELIKKYEGCRLEAYKDFAGKWTVGYGHTGKDVCDGLRIDEFQAIGLLSGDLLEANAQLNFELGPIKVNENQRAALLSFVFNLGIGALKRSTLFQLIKSNAKPVSVALEFAKWCKSNDVVLPGLVKRRAEETILYLS
jgi:lysozyme